MAVSDTTPPPGGPTEPTESGPIAPAAKSPRLQLAAPYIGDAAEVPVSRDDRFSWENVRRLFVEGICCGPGMPDRTEVLARVGEEVALLKPKVQRGGWNGVIRVGQYQVVFPTLRGVAKYFRIVPEEILFDRARSEEWQAQQQVYRIRLRHKHLQYKEQERRTRLIKIDGRAHATAALGLKMVHDRLVVLTSTIDVGDMADGEVRMMADPREMDSLARAAQTWHALASRALGRPVEMIGTKEEQQAEVVAPEFLAAMGARRDGDIDVGEIAPDTRFDGGLLNAEDGVVEDKRSVASELSRDDAERLHGFLSVLGRAQQASQGEEDGDGEAQKEIGTGTI